MVARIGLILVAAILLAASVYFYLHRPIRSEKKPLILGHAGSGVRSVIPINSLASVQNAFRYPISGVELDIQMTADSCLVAFHDSLLSSTTSCTGRVSEYTLRELSNCLQTTWLREAPIATLAAIIESSERGKVFSLDLKQSFGENLTLQKAYVRQLAALLETYPENDFIFECDDLQILTAIRAENDAAQLFLLSDDVDRAIEIARTHRLSGISIHHTELCKTDMGQLKAHHLKVMLWGGGSLLSNRAMLLHEPDYIQTDDLGSMMQLLR